MRRPNARASCTETRTRDSTNKFDEYKFGNGRCASFKRRTSLSAHTHTHSHARTIFVVDVQEASRAFYFYDIGAYPQQTIAFYALQRLSRFVFIQFVDAEILMKFHAASVGCAHSALNVRVSKWFCVCIHCCWSSHTKWIWSIWLVQSVLIKCTCLSSLALSKAFVSVDCVSVCWWQAFSPSSIYLIISFRSFSVTFRFIRIRQLAY